jgi:hypothetical protein
MLLLPLAVLALSPVPLEMVRVAQEQQEHHARLIRELDDDSFAVRERATEALIRLGRSALPEVLTALRRPASPEVEKRLERIVADYADAPSSRGNVVSGLRAILSTERRMFRESEAIALTLTVHRVDTRAPRFKAMEDVEDPIDRTSLNLRSLGEGKRRVHISSSPNDAVVEVVQFSGEPPPSLTINSCGTLKVKQTRALRQVIRGASSDIVHTQQIRLSPMFDFRLPPGAYEVRLVYLARQHGAREDLVSDPIFILVEPARKK